MRCYSGTIQHGYVLFYNCQRLCEYFCFPPYKRSSTDKYVNCHTTSGNWLTTSGEQPCIKADEVTTTTKIFATDSSDVPSFTSFKDEDNFVSATDHDDINVRAITGVIATCAAVILLVVVRLLIIRTRSAKQSTQMPEVEVNSQIHQNREAQAQQEIVTPHQSPTNRTNSEHEHEDRGMIIFSIRQWFGISLLRNPYNTFRNPSEPPPYDAASAPPPTYEETEGVSRSTRETAEVTCGERLEIPVDSPPPYTV
ncbi:uncharacterized protein LOC123563928 isoform X1 [Mercenaria mercenaria]|uniref:uncharacterized protein LOC123563928 isoform X1 n=1 Tax=Mercenaria mercenaria TaxID=6596 RepID=UPI00234EA735|nr:uncharacterized protein LOC123563928 isoform X1 [Mercenaria mercenaria]XP_045213032.2 uncharacterized protein LOC123563928 isoform X1 [Mercenaria mercenaria]